MINVGTANQLLFQLQQGERDQLPGLVLEDLTQLSQGIFASSQSDRMWLNASQCVFNVQVLNLTYHDLKYTWTLKKLAQTLTDTRHSLEVLMADVEIGPATLNLYVMHALQTVSMLCTDEDMLEDLIRFSQRELAQFIATRDFENEFTNVETAQRPTIDKVINQKVAKLLVKYHFTDHRPYVFQDQEEPKVNVDKLAKWGLKNNIIVSLHQTENGRICNIEWCYFQLYCKLYVN